MQSLLTTFEQNVNLQDTLVGCQVVEEHRLEYQKSHNFAHKPSGCLVPISLYLEFVKRNGMWGLADELIHTTTPDQASKVIGIRFSQARYSAQEILSLRECYQKMSKPLQMGAALIVKSSGKMLLDSTLVEKCKVDSFDAFSDSVVELWQSLWSVETLTRITEDSSALACIRKRDHGVILWCLETSKSEDNEQWDWLEDMPHEKPMKPKHHEKPLENSHKVSTISASFSKVFRRKKI